jgi:integrase
MPQAINKLTEVAVKALKPDAKPRLVGDGGGLFLLVKPNGAKLWRARFRFAGRQDEAALGAYPEVGLAEARRLAATIRQQLREGLHPRIAKKQAEQEFLRQQANTFGAVAAEWLESRSTLAATTKETDEWKLGKLLPYLGSRPIAEIDALQMLEVVRREERAGRHEAARRALQTAGAVFRYALKTGRAATNPCAHLRGALKAPKVRHLPAITDADELGRLLRAMDGYDGAFTVRCALRLAPLLFCRPGELRQARWSYVDWTGRRLVFPEELMKVRDRGDYVVPLSTQALAILRELHAVTGTDGAAWDGYLFPNVRDRHKPMSENTVNKALRRLGFDGNQVTGHGFRTTATTMLNELGWHADVIERQLAHVEGNQVRRAYHRASYLPERTKMMQAWADHLDNLKHPSEKSTKRRSAVTGPAPKSPKAAQVRGR